MVKNSGNTDSFSQNQVTSIRLILLYFFSSLFIISDGLAQTTPYPDQLFIIETGDSLFYYAESVKDIALTDDGTSIRLTDGATNGYIILKPESAFYPFDRGLPSWNGTVPGDSASFRVFIRFPYLSGWSPYLEVGYWKENLWQGQKSTTFNGGRIAIDTAILYDYASQWQFKIEMKRLLPEISSPTLTRLSFFASDHRTTQQNDFTAILDDKPAAIFIPTTFLAQYKISDQYGGRICSPTTVAMILLSYQIAVDPLQFALDTYDPYYHIFGVWPRVVQNASEYGLKGTVTRYRSWSQARDVLASGGRIGMSIGQPLYGGHLVMLAGFTESGDPIVHDPARSNDGYGHVFDKADLSHAWFDKGGVAYTFYLSDSSKLTGVDFARQDNFRRQQQFVLYPNYPNPFNSGTMFVYKLTTPGYVEISIYNMMGQMITMLDSQYRSAGTHHVQWDGTNSAGVAVASGQYLYRLRFDQTAVKWGKLLLIR